MRKSYYGWINQNKPSKYKPDEGEFINILKRDFSTTTINEKHNVYVAHLHNMGISDVIEDSYIKENERLLSDGIWCIVELSYD